MIQARMKNPAMIVPGAMQALQALAKSAEQGGVPLRTLALAHSRASQINGCSVCVAALLLGSPFVRDFLSDAAAHRRRDHAQLGH